MQDFSDKVVVITGASAGVGGACARQFHAAGAKLVLAARGAQKLQELADELGGDTLVVPTDVQDLADCEALIDRAVQAFGRIDVLVNNAGVNNRGAVKDIPARQLAQIIEVNLRAPIVLTQLALPHMQKGGAVVNVASIAGQIPVPHEATYSASKFGLRAFTYALAEELQEAGITASVVSPGPIDTGFIMEDLDSVPDIIFAQPMSTAEQIADMVVACSRDGKVERSRPALTHALASLGYFVPSLPKLIKPLMEPKGRRAKERFRARNQAG